MRRRTLPTCVCPCVNAPSRKAAVVLVFGDTAVTCRLRTDAHFQLTKRYASEACRRAVPALHKTCSITVRTYVSLAPPWQCSTTPQPWHVACMRSSSYKCADRDMLCLTRTFWPTKSIGEG